MSAMYSKKAELGITKLSGTVSRPLSPFSRGRASGADIQASVHLPTSRKVFARSNRAQDIARREASRLRIRE